MNYSIEFLRGWLRGFFDGEGGCYFYKRAATKYPSYKIACGNNDFNLMIFAIEALKTLGIEGRLYKRRKPSPSNPKTTEVYQLNIYRHEDILKFADLVSFQSDAKQKKLEELCKWIRRPAFITGQPRNIHARIGNGRFGTKS